MPIFLFFIQGVPAANDSSGRACRRGAGISSLGMKLDGADGVGALGCDDGSHGSTGPEQPTGFLADVTLSLHKGYRRKPLKLK